ncbi:septum formation family protein [Nonomuraea sp. NPDC059023]|uniref:septum formation family protein n=1 Tax=unclassified Nonomuraea TaxID=2593643 RepID=UPI0036A959F2
MAEAAGSALYTRNAFRVTGLSTYADRRTIRRRRQKVLSALEVGADFDLGHDLPVGHDEVRAAFDRLQLDPRLRLVDEVFWLWETPDASCSCPASLHRDHDLAVLAHSAALDRELAPGHPVGQDLTDLKYLWSEAGRQWGMVLRRAVFWDHLRHRIEALDDRQLAESDIDALRGELPTALVKPLIELTARQGPGQWRLANVARSWPMVPGRVIDDLLEEIAAPIYEEIRAALQAALQALEAGDPMRAAEIVDERAVPCVPRLEKLVPHERHRATANVRDEIAIVLNNCAAALLDRYGPAAVDLSVRGLLDKAAGLTSDPHTVERIKQNRDAMDEAVKAFEQIERQARSWVIAGRPRVAVKILREVRRVMPDQPWRDELLDQMAARLGVSLPRPTSLKRFSLRRFLTWLVRWDRRVPWLLGFSLVLAAILWNSWFGASSDAVLLFSEAKAENAAIGTCVEAKDGWGTGQKEFQKVGCDQSHWGEVLGYVPLGKVPSPYPGEDRIRSAAAFECARLQARQNLSFDTYTTSYLVPDKELWNDGGGRFENYTPCVLTRRGDGPATGKHVVDPPPKPESAAVVTMDLHPSRRTEAPPVGSCVVDQKAWKADPHKVPIGRCDLPHWAEILGYPILFSHSQAWPGDDKVWRTAKAKCDELGTRKKHRMNVNWPGEDWWQDKTLDLYAVCLASREDDKKFTGGLP